MNLRFHKFWYKSSFSLEAKSGIFTVVGLMNFYWSAIGSNICKFWNSGIRVDAVLMMSKDKKYELISREKYIFVKETEWYFRSGLGH